MKPALIIAAVVMAAALLWWPRHPSFDQRWLAMPPAMSWELISKARKAADRPTFTPHCKWPSCRLSVYS
jgi:hypothetical protein